MIIGSPKELQAGEKRVAMTPASASQLLKLGFECIIETGAGVEAGFSDADYKAAGVKIIKTAANLWKQSDIIIKVQAVNKVEEAYLNKDKTVITTVIKRMKKKVSEIVVRYKNIPHNIFSSDTKVHSNQLVLRIHPDEGVDLKLNTKEPSVSGFNLEELPLDLNLQDYYEMGHQDCYERLLLDVIKGNQALFVRKDEIEASWEWIDSITKLWNSEDIPMDEYSSGSWGPSSSELMLSKENKKWIRIFANFEKSPSL